MAIAEFDRNLVLPQYNMLMTIIDQLVLLLVAVAGQRGSTELSRYSKGGDLFADQILDSLTVMEFVLAVEEHFLLEFSANEVTFENVSSLPALAALIESKRRKT